MLVPRYNANLTGIKVLPEFAYYGWLKHFACDVDTNQAVINLANDNY